MAAATPTRDAVVAAVRQRQDECVALLSDLVRFDSVLDNEQAVQDYCATYLRDSLALQVQRVPLDHDVLSKLPGYSPPYLGVKAAKDSVVGVHVPKSPPSAERRPLIFNGHTDVVPVSGSTDRWQTGPFEPSVRDGYLYGRGAGDMKGGVAAMLFALRTLRHLGFQPAAPVCVQCVVEEENTGNGTLAACNAVAADMKPGGRFAGAAVIVPEPFNHQLTLSQIGTIWMQIEVSGKPVHVLNTSAGSNAIESAMKLWNALKPLEERMNAPERRHRDYVDHPHPINFNLGQIEGGDWPSSVPSRCLMQIRIATYPGEELPAFRKEVEDFVRDAAKQLAIEYQLRWTGFQAEGSTVDKDCEFFRALARTHEQVLSRPIQSMSLTCTTDARHFILYHKLAATCYGPEGNPIHGIDERVSISSMIDVAAVLAAFIVDWCGLEPVPSS